MRATDEQIEDLAARMEWALLELGRRLGMSEFEVCTLVNNAGTPKEHHHDEGGTP